MKTAFGGASRAALIVALGSLGWASTAWAQQPPANQDSNVDEVVVTGSLIRGTALDTALPVEVVTQGELEKRGSPTALEFAKSLTISGPTTGEAYYFSGAQLTGSVNYNLRSLGIDKTLTLLNGKRVSQNTSNIPFMALARTEILKDGAAVTYGADAVGGVVNFVTMDRYTGLELTAAYKHIRGSSGDYTAGILGGIGEGPVNLLFSAEYEHRSRLSTMERDFSRASLDPTVTGYNPAPWSGLTNVAAWIPRGTLPATPSVTNEFGTATNATVAAPGGVGLSDFSPTSCAAIGGRYDSANACAYNYIPYYNLVEENNIYRAYLQLNAQITDRLKLHTEVAYSQVSSPAVYGSPAQPTTTGPAMATGATNQYYVPVTNPHAAAFAARVGAPVGTQGFTAVTYRAFAHGGNPVMGNGDGFGVPSRIENQVFRVSSELQGELGEFGNAVSDVNYRVGLTYNQANNYADAPDIIGYRLQQALNGFGGPNCNVPDLDPNRFGTQNAPLAGVGNCSYWNPFATNFSKQPVTGAANPQYVAGAENSAELTRWLFDTRATRTIVDNLTLDATISGRSGLELPGGAVGWAAGFQARALQSRETVNSPLYNGQMACPWPVNFTSTNGANGPLSNFPASPTDAANFRGCTPDGPGPFTFFGINPPDELKQRQHSYFGELQVPVLDNLDFQLAVRNEQFSGGLKATVYKVAGKWQIIDQLAIRGSYGTNYTAPALGTIPGNVTNAVRSYTIAGSQWLGAQFVTRASLSPETAKTWNIGAIWKSKGFMPDHNAQLIVDYFNIETQDEIGQLADPNQIANLVFNGAGGTVTTCDPTVQPLINRVTFNAGCTVGMAAVSGGIAAFSSIRTDVGNGPGQTTNGVDIQATYSFPAGPGDLTLGLNATQVLELKTGRTTLDGVVVSTGDDRLGFLNYATVAAAAPKLRANFSLNYALERQNIRLGINYVSSVVDERAGIVFGKNGEDYVTADLTYRYEITPDFAITGTIANILDRDPPRAQEELGYDPRLGNPLGRTFEIGLKKSF